MGLNRDLIQRRFHDIVRSLEPIKTPSIWHVTACWSP